MTRPNDGKRVYKLRFYPCTYKHFRAWMKLMGDDADSALQGFLCNVNKRAMKNEFLVKQRMRAWTEHGVFIDVGNPWNDSMIEVSREPFIDDMLRRIEENLFKRRPAKEGTA